MPVHGRTLEVVREWIAKAENDLKTAVHTLKLGKDCPTDTTCSHAQQYAEKHVKAALVHAGVSPSRFGYIGFRVVWQLEHSPGTSDAWRKQTREQRLAALRVWLLQSVER
jgi:hypothetical protein